MGKFIRNILSRLTKSYTLELIYIQIIILFQSIFQILSILSLGPVFLFLTNNKDSAESISLIDIPYTNLQLEFKTVLSISIIFYCLKYSKFNNHKAILILYKLY